MTKEENRSADFVSEMKHAVTEFHNLAPNATTMSDAAIALRKLHGAFPRVLKLFKIALTLPVSIASCKLSFSCI
jgi:hAT family C-terminal dimerisation region